jgi:serine/threonine-protein kinase
VSASRVQEISGAQPLPAGATPAPFSAPTGPISAPLSVPPSNVVISSAPETSGQWGNAAEQPEGKKDPNVGKVFGDKYQIERVLGEGGMGIVYGARHKAIGKKFAIKLLHGDATKDPEVVERFKVEAQAASSIGNEHIIDITDFAELPDGGTYFVMEFLDGKALTKLFEELKRLPTMRLVKIAKQISRGLGAAHQAGIVHRDLKPDNIFLCKRSGGETDFVKILDFGIAKVGQSANKLTKAGAIFGTPHYMSPEQASGSPIDHRTDIYSLGVILYEGAVGRVPFDADNFMGILTQHMYKAPVPPRALPECPPDLPPGLEVIIMRCLRKKPEERYQTMEELEQDLDRLANGEVPKAAQDMMALSAGYQSLAQSALAAAGMPKPIPAEPMIAGVPRSKWPLYAGVAGVVVVVGIATAALMGGKSNAKAAPSNTVTATDAPKPTATQTAAVTETATTSAPVPTVAKKTRTILVDPPVPTAKIFDDQGKQIGDGSPGAQAIDIPEGTTKTFTVKAAGYKDATITLDYVKSPKKITPQMKAIAGGGGATTKPNGGGGSDIDNPWGKK